MRSADALSVEQESARPSAAARRPALLRPALALTDRLRTGTRLAVLVALLLVPGLVAAWSYTAVIGGQVRFTNAERRGVEVVRPALEALVATAQDDRTAQGDRTAGGDLTASGALGRAVADHPELGLDQAFAAVRDAASAVTTSTTAARPAARAALAGHLVDLITATGNSSNLILDPDLDSFYVMDALVVQVPKALLAAVQAGAPPEGDLASRVAAQAVVAGTLTGAVSGISGDVDTAARHTAQPGMAQRLGSLTAVAARGTSLAGSLTSSLSRPTAAGPAAVDALAASVTAALGPATGELDALLAAREAALVGDRTRTLLIAALGLLIAGWFALGVIWRTRTDVGLALGAVTEIARGRLEPQPLPDGVDEFGDIGRALATARVGLEQQSLALAAAHEARERQLGASFEHQRMVQRQVRDRAQKIIDDTSGIVAEELRGVTSQIGEARTAAGTIGDRVRAADQVTRSVVAQAREAETVVQALEVSLQQVAGMAQLIAGVADQTKLLALNATIEAARAGVAGRGFSVVANEVKGLAMATARSSGQITATIGTLEDDARAMAGVIATMTRRISGLDETTAELSSVAVEQHAFVERLGSSLTEAIERVAGMSALTQTLERRSHERHPVRLPGSLIRDGQLHQVEIYDLGEGGLRCRYAGPVEARSVREGECVQIVLTPGARRLELAAIVMRVDDHDTAGELGLQFLEPDADAVAAIRDHVAALAVGALPGS